MPRHPSLPAWGLLVFWGAALFLGFLNLAGFLMNDDEGNYLYAAWRVSLGEIPFRDFTIVQAPLSFYLGAAVFKVFGPTVWGARALSVLFMVGASFLLYIAARRFFKLECGFALISAAVFLFNKHIFFLGRSFMPDVPMIFFGMAALFIALRGEEDESSLRDNSSACRPLLGSRLKAESLPPSKEKRKDAFLVGLFSGLAALAKLNGALVFAGYVAFLAIEGIRNRKIRKDASIKAALAAGGFILSFGIPFGLLLIFIPESYDGLIGFHAAKEAAGAISYLGLIAQRLGQVVGNHNYGLVAGVLAALFFHRGNRDRRRTLLWASAGATMVLLFLPSRFFLRYILFAIAPLALLFGLGVKRLWVRNTAGRIGLPVLAVLVGLCLAPTLSPKKILAHDEGTRAVVSFIREHTRPEDFVFGDDPFLNFLAKRPCPPRLVDVSEAMMTAGRITAAEIRENCERHAVKLVFVEKGASAHHLVKLKDFALFQKYLDEKFRPAGKIRREFLDVELYLRIIDEPQNRPPF